MEYRRGSQYIAVRLDDGDELISCLKGIFKKEGLRSVLVSGIGAARKAEIGHYDTKLKKYNTKSHEGMLEIVSLSGNITMLEGEPAPHIHIAISRHDYSTLSGHLFSAEIYPTCEIVLIPLGIDIEKKHDERTGVNLQSFR